MAVADWFTVARAAAAPFVVLLFEWDFPNHDYWATALFAVAMATDCVAAPAKDTPVAAIVDPELTIGSPATEWAHVRPGLTT